MKLCMSGCKWWSMEAEANVCESPEANNSMSHVNEAARRAPDSKDDCRRSREYGFWRTRRNFIIRCTSTGFNLYRILQRRVPLLDTPNTHGNRQTWVVLPQANYNRDVSRKGRPHSGLRLSAYVFQYHQHTVLPNRRLTIETVYISQPKTRNWLRKGK